MLILAEATADLVCMGSAFEGNNRVWRGDQEHIIIGERWKNGEACNWLRKSLTDGLFNILPIGTLEVVFWYVALFAFFTSSGLKGLE